MGVGGAPPSLRGAQADPDPCSAFARRNAGSRVPWVARGRQRTWSIPVGLDYPEASGNGSISCRGRRPPHDRRVVTFIVQGREVSALPEATDRTRLHSRPDAEARPRLCIERPCADLRNVEGHASLRRRWRAENLASGRTAVTSIGQRSAWLRRICRTFESRSRCGEAFVMRRTRLRSCGAELRQSLRSTLGRSWSASTHTAGTESLWSFRRARHP